MKRKPVVALDGPAGSGKSTIAKLVAAKLGLHYLDTGAMYRSITLKALRTGTDTKNEAALTALALSTKIDFVYGGEKLRVLMDGEDVTEAIRLPEVSKTSSDIADSIGVRKELVKKQQELGLAGGVIIDGRDIGSLVFPDAEVKIYLDASVKERALRRFKELEARGIKTGIGEVEKDICERDERDRSRPFGALKKVPEAVVLDTTKMSILDVVERIVEIIKKNSQV